MVKQYMKTSTRGLNTFYNHINNNTVALCIKTLRTPYRSRKRLLVLDKVQFGVLNVKVLIVKIESITFSNIEGKYIYI